MNSEALELIATAVDRLHLLLCQEMGRVGTADPEQALENFTTLLGKDSLLETSTTVTRLEAELSDLESDLYLFDPEARSRIRKELTHLRELIRRER